MAPLLELPASVTEATSRLVDDSISFDATFRAVEEVLHDAVESALERVEDAATGAASEALSVADIVARATIEGAKRLLHFDELPPSWQDNHHIHTGYRFLTSPKRCLLSVFELHNETGNIWSHLLGFFYFLFLSLAFFSQSTLSLADRAVFTIFFFAVAKCLICSATWHTFAHFSHLPTMRACASVDYMGISVLIVASQLLIEYYGFYCDMRWGATYMFITSVLGFVACILPWFQWFDEQRLIRIVFYVTLAASALVPVCHLFYVEGITKTLGWLSFEINSSFWYLFGVLLYASHWPERFWPGRFDRWGNSHQLWHICVLLGAYWQYRAAYVWSQQRASSCETGYPFGPLNLQLHTEL